MLTSDQLDAMRETLEASLPETARIMRLSLVANGKGGQTEESDEVEEVAARLEPLNERREESTFGGRLGSVVAWIITLPYGTEIQQADQLVINGRTFEVTGVKGGRTYEISTRVECREIL